MARAPKAHIAVLLVSKLNTTMHLLQWAVSNKSDKYILFSILAQHYQLHGCVLEYKGVHLINSRL